VYADDATWDKDSRDFAGNVGGLAFWTLAQTIAVWVHLSPTVWTLWTTILGHSLTSSASLFQHVPSMVVEPRAQRQCLIRRA